MARHKTHGYYNIILFYCAGSQANEGRGIFCWCFTHWWFSPKYNVFFIFFLNCHLTGFRKSTLQEHKVVAILRSWATSYVKLFRKQHDRLNALLLFESLGRTWLTFASLSSWSGGWETYSSEMKAEVFLVLPRMGPFWSTPPGRCPGQSVDIHGGGRASSSQAQLWETGWALHSLGCNLCKTKWAPSSLGRWDACWAFGNALAGGCVGTFPLQCLGSLMPTLSPCLFRARLLLLLS